MTSQSFRFFSSCFSSLNLAFEIVCGVMEFRVVERDEHGERARGAAEGSLSRSSFASTSSPKLLHWSFGFGCLISGDAPGSPDSKES